MALEPCDECGKEYSTRAAACPHCGAPSWDEEEEEAEPQETATDSMFWLTKNCFGCAIAIVLVNLALLLVMCGNR